MTQVDLHPEELFDGMRAGLLEPEAHARLLTHCSHCEPCRFELLLVQGAQRATAEDALGEQLAAAALRRLALPPTAASTRPKNRALASVAAALVLGCSFGAAALFTRYPERVALWVRGESSVPSLRAAAPSRSRRLQTATEVTPPMALEPASPDPREVPIKTLDVANEAPVPPPKAASPEVHRKQHGGGRARSRSRPAVVAPVGAAAESDAEVALGLATRARSQGLAIEAVERYRHVIELYPEARAAGAAQVALGRLLYAERRQPWAALSLFDSYLARAGNTPLAEEALYYRGLCLVALRRFPEASASLRQLLQNFPDSMYAAQARAQLSRQQDQ